MFVRDNLKECRDIKRVGKMLNYSYYSIHDKNIGILENGKCK